MRLLLPSDELRALAAALDQAGTNEIGGQIFGEQIAPSDFRVTELTFQQRHGTFAQFIVDLVQAAGDALGFFDRTEHRYTRYNYVGEWHSHPSFEVHPSSTDVATMRGMVRERGFKGNFAVLMIVRLDGSTVTCGGWLFAPDGREEPIAIDTIHD